MITLIRFWLLGSSSDGIDDDAKSRKLKCSSVELDPNRAAADNSEWWRTAGPTLAMDVVMPSILTIPTSTFWVVMRWLKWGFGYVVNVLVVEIGRQLV